ncbi:hypothetical protein FISHEDRAFT_33526 [Fistulina hepatica ATCC 64428]|uniref:CxC2-like cysteine cluster KDZ transposase-associated domain-containing protein n=1 Tax=Fistulina hepatica ATCC 64428 TaxID=1128425 RepID=A0A0D7AR97_9AGAR|nr:hypothetical protein FISHEDRAFT_33526 [Fistulina hepatica ATCC 64428]
MQDYPFLGWIPEVPQYLQELLRRDGRQGATEICLRCQIEQRGVRGQALYRCRDCDEPDLLCGTCILDNHQSRPLCRIEMWNGQFFERYSLRQLGLVVQLGHGSHDSCYTPQMAPTDFVVIDTNGLHFVNVLYCACTKSGDAGPYRSQLLRHGWYPATNAEPKTCVTFRCLEMFHTMTLQGKVTTYDFYNGLEKLGNNTSIKDNLNFPHTDRYKSFMRCIREWRYLKMLKRAGRGHDRERGVIETHPGELAIVCPACPRPGVNLPDDWKDAPLEWRFLYIVFLAVDACFRLKRRLVSSTKKDPDLVDGKAYFTEHEPFRKYLLTVTDQKEMSTCSGLAALDHANTKYSKGYSETGKGLVCCTRHEFVQPNGVVSLQKGERRYANMDYAFASALRHVSADLPKVVSYDIVCQWWKNLAARLKTLPSHIRINIVLHMYRFVIPKLHIHGHQTACRLTYALSYLVGAGRTDGEGIERAWANMGPVATSTVEMGPGGSHDTLEDHWAGWNWGKLIGLGDLLLRRLLAALEQRSVHKAALKEFSRGQESYVKAWAKRIIDWERDNSQPNPYELPENGLTEAKVRLQLAEEDEEAAKKDGDTNHASDVSPAAFISEGLDLEDVGIAKAEAQFAKLTDAQQMSLMTRRAKLRRGITRLRRAQNIHTPTAIQAAEAWALQVKDSDDRLAELVPLFLPSSLSPAQCASIPSSTCDTEARLRHAQCQSALDGVRSFLFIKTGLISYRKSHVRHQGATTRSRSLLERNEVKIQYHAAKYNMARRALIALLGVESVTWPLLRKKDLRLPEDSENLARRSQRKIRGKKRKNIDDETTPQQENDSEDAEVDERPLDARLSHLKRCREAMGDGYRQISWIWNSAGASGAMTDNELCEVLRVEWSKAYSRTKRWCEEVLLLKEEMRRTLVSFEHKADWWDMQVQGPLTDDEQLSEGASAYAKKQAHLYRSLAAECRRLWGAYASGSLPDPEDPDEVDVDVGLGLLVDEEPEIEEDLNQWVRSDDLCIDVNMEG